MTDDLYPTPRAAAGLYAALGWRVAPVRPGTKVPIPPAWQDVATTDESILDAWWRKYPDAGVCIVTGRASGIWVLDVDVADGKPGVASLRALVDEHEGIGAKLPETLVAVTPSGGFHYFFSYPDDVEIRNSAGNKLGPGLDVRGEGGQVNAAPTTRGFACYRWADGRAPWEAEVQPAPAWLVEMVAEGAFADTANRRIEETFDHRPMVPASVFLDNTPAWVDEFNRSRSWTELLAGWTLDHTDRDDVDHWVRPGKDRREGTSATVNYGGQDCLYVYTTSIPWLPSDRMYDKYGYVVHRDYGGDFRAAAEAFKPAPAVSSAATAELLSEGYKTAPPLPGDEAEQSRLRSLEIDFRPDGPFWNTDETESEWLIRDFVARGRGHALYSGAKTGKSFVALDAIAASCIPGHEAWTKSDEPITVVYLDYEMTEADVRERLEGFGYGPNDDYSRFHYVRAMAFGEDLDTHVGGAEVLAYALARRADLVVVDTMSRAVRGDENDADTVRHFYQATGGLLKGHGIALLRLDHAGKTSDKGQRGSSGKNDDVDVVWRLDRAEGGSVMMCTHKRMGWVPEKVTIENGKDADGLTTLRRPAGETREMWPAGTAAKAAEMDAIDLPLDASRNQAKAAGLKGDSGVLSAALRYRRQQNERVFPVADQSGRQGADRADSARPA